LINSAIINQQIQNYLCFPLPKMSWMKGIDSDDERDEDGDGDGDEGEGNEDGRGGSQATSKALILFLVDCHLNMHRLYKFNDGTKSDEKITETTYFKRVFKKLHAICRDKLKKGQLDHVGVVLFNSKDMDNQFVFPPSCLQFFV